MNAAAILAIPLSEPERMFSREYMKDEFRSFAKRWHPDAGGDAAVFSHIVKLFEAAEEKAGRGEWHIPGLLEISTATTDFRIRYLKRHETETGYTYICNTFVLHATRNDFADIVHAGRKIMDGFTYASDRMRKEVSRYLPKPTRAFEAKGVQYMMVEKTSDLVLLRDLIDHCGGKLDPKHAAWIISSMLNVACYLEYAGLVHNAIGPDTYFVSPPLHGGALLGGWWYAARKGEKMVALPKRTFGIIPAGHKQATPRTDLSLIRMTAREMLGPDAPKPMLEWTRWASPTGSAVADYDHWMNKVLKDSFGARRFTEMKVTASDIYRKD